MMTPGDSSAAPLPHEGSEHERLWTPWRMQYVGATHRPAGCIFCRALASNEDVKHLVLHRGTHAFIMMNLFPYNTGHVMLVPNQHVGSPEFAGQEATVELAEFRGPTLRAFRRALSCEAFNLGLNVGSVAGAGIAEHMHEHLVPRWTGDANFMPILANTMVLPELLPVSYAKLRAELTREFSGVASAAAVVLSPDRSRVLTEESDMLWRVALVAPKAVWQTLGDELQTALGAPVRLLGWGGSPAAEPRDIVLTVESEPAANSPSRPGRRRWLPVAAAADLPGGNALKQIFGNLHLSTPPIAE